MKPMAPIQMPVPAMATSAVAPSSNMERAVIVSAAATVLGPLVNAVAARMIRAEEPAETVRKETMLRADKIFASLPENTRRKLMTAIADSYNGNITNGITVSVTIGEITYKFTSGNLTEKVRALKGVSDRTKANIMAELSSRFSSDLLSYEVGYAVVRDQATGEYKVKLSDKASLIFDEDGRMIDTNCTETVDPNDRVVFRGHTHPDYVNPDTDKAEWARKTVIDRQNLDSGAFGAIPGLMIIQRMPDGTLVPTMLARTMAYETANIDAAIANIFTAGWNIERGFTVNREGSAIETIRSPIKAVIELMESAPVLVNAIANRSRNKESLIEHLKSLQEKLQTSDNMAATAQLTTLDNLALILKEAGVLKGSIGVAINARRGAFDGSAALTEIIKAISLRKSDIVHYVILTDDPIAINECDKAGIKAISRNEDHLSFFKTLDINDTSLMVMATTEKAIEGIVSDNGSNYFIGNKEEVLAGSEGKVPAGALLAAIERSIFKVDNQKEESVIIAVGCNDDTISKLQGIFKSGFRLFRLAKLEIDRLVREFLTAVQATARSL
jgi:hypothetical protein